MALFRKPKTIPYQAANPDAVKDLPFASTVVYPEIEIEFVNAQVNDQYTRQLMLALLSIDSSLNAQIAGTNLPSIATHKGIAENGKATYTPVPIFIGSPTEPDNEILYFNPQIRQDKPSFYANVLADCTTSFLFANVRATISVGRGINKQSRMADPVPYGIPATPVDLTGTTQTIFIDQRVGDVEIRAMDMVVVKLGLGLSVVSDRPLLSDTWFDGSWETFSTGGVGVGYVNASDHANKPFAVGSRYDWTFGSIYLVKSFGASDKITNTFGLQEINYEYEDNSVKLVGWKYEVADSSTAKGESVVGGHILSPFDDTKVMGRQLVTYLLKSLEEGRCITIRNNNGGIEIGVNFFHNGNCCECVKASSSSLSSLSSNNSTSSSSDSSHSSTSSSSNSSSSSSSSNSSSSSSSNSSSSNSSSSSGDISQTSESSSSS